MKCAVGLLDELTPRGSCVEVRKTDLPRGGVGERRGRTQEKRLRGGDEGHVRGTSVAGVSRSDEHTEQGFLWHLRNSLLNSEVETHRSSVVHDLTKDDGTYFGRMILN